MAEQAILMAHLRPLPRCRCGKAATQELRNGFNAVQGVYCDRCGRSALRRFRERA